ncbi:DUF5957 family protein [Paenibacillus urinalis]|uniref:DUF5957 family protein n=1 Tax=Paenibacillus urinalis TaxID=521520 RepID=A0AAX3MUC6_9BACL|nr:DUF5957 family protein [Paenibacillus urinalis]WDH80389.1 DUF5957 family protein [Paenibacillus urinalis]
MKKALLVTLSIVLGLIGGFIGGVILTEILAIIGIFLFESPEWLRFLKYGPIVTGVIAAALLARKALLPKGTKQQP